MAIQMHLPLTDTNSIACITLTDSHCVRTGTF